MNTVTVSVIIPVYNSEKHLNICIDSVLAQTYSDFELLLINDGSTDSSGAICDYYAEKDSRVKVFHKENGGVSSARNAGLNNMTGQWVCFVDSDDWVEKDYIRCLVEDICNNESDFVIHGNRGRENSLNSILINEDSGKIETIFDIFEKIQISWNGYPWSKLFKYSIIKKNKIYFPLNINLNEDTLFVLKYVSKCSSIYYNNILYYHYIDDNEGSLSNQKTIDYRSSSLAFHKINNILKNDFDITDISVYPSLRSTVLMFLYNSFRAMYKNNFPLRKRINCYKYLWNSSTVNLGHDFDIKGLLLKLFRVRQFWIIDIVFSFLYRTKLNTLYVKYKQ